MQPNERLKEERERFRLTQQQLADIAGVHRNAQGNYETGARKPDLSYLEKISAYGLDVNYIITGFRSDFTRDDMELIALFRQASLEKKLMAVQLLKGEAIHSSAVTQSNTGTHQQISGSGDIINKRKGK